MYKLEFTLRQHTPLIHFQHEQEGATLRASEVKPKLDKFIIESCGGLITCRKNYPEWFLSQSQNSLSFKITISVAGEQFNFTKSIVSVEKELFLYESLLVKVSSLHRSLIAVINNTLEAFFITTNFGNRASKGYGSFTVSSINGLQVSNTNRINRETLNNYFSFFGSVSFGPNIEEIREFNASDLFQLKKKDFGNNEELADEYKRQYRFSYYIPNNIRDLNEIYKSRNLRTQIINDFELKANRQKELLIRNFPSLRLPIEKKFSDQIAEKKTGVVVTFYNNILDQIEMDNRLLKSGRNTGFPRDYRKSEIFFQFIDHGIVWEKRLIKKHINSLPASVRCEKTLAYQNPPSIDENKRNNTWDDTFALSDYRFVRALLGLPEQYEFKTNASNFKFLVQFESSSKSVDRYQSPLFFKVVDGDVYVCLKRDYKIICGQSFNINFIVKERVNDNWVERKNLPLYHDLKVPSEAELLRTNFVNFLQSFFRNMYYE